MCCPKCSESEASHLFETPQHALASLCSSLPSWLSTSYKWPNNKIRLAIQWRSFSITHFLLPRPSQHFSNHQKSPYGTRNTLKAQLSKSRTFPIVFTQNPTLLESFCRSTLSSFYSVDHRATIPQVLAQSFGKDQGNYVVARAYNIHELSIYLRYYLIRSSNMPSISALAKDMTVSFPQIVWLILWSVWDSECLIDRWWLFESPDLI